MTGALNQTFRMTTDLTQRRNAASRTKAERDRSPVAADANAGSRPLSQAPELCVRAADGGDRPRSLGCGLAALTHSVKILIEQLAGKRLRAGERTRLACSFQRPRWKHRAAGNVFDEASNTTAGGGCAPHSVWFVETLALILTFSPGEKEQP